MDGKAVPNSSAVGSGLKHYDPFTCSRCYPGQFLLSTLAALAIAPVLHHGAALGVGTICSAMLKVWPGPEKAWLASPSKVITLLNRCPLH